MDEFREWLERNEKILKGRTPDEIAELARAVGMSPIAVAQWRTHQRFGVTHE